MINWIFFLFAIESSLFFTTTVWVPPFQTLCQTFKLDWKSFAIKKYHCAVCCAAAELSTSSQWYQFDWLENVSQKPICSGWWTLAFSHLISSLCSWLKNCCLEWNCWCFFKSWNTFFWEEKKKNILTIHSLLYMYYNFGSLKSWFWSYQYIVVRRKLICWIFKTHIKKEVQNL